MRNSSHPITNKQKLSFTFNGKKYFGYKGDTLASALIANNVKIVGRSFKYHRPRGIFSSFCGRPSSAHVSGGLRGPFWEPFWPQKCSFVDHVFWSRGSFF